MNHDVAPRIPVEGPQKILERVEADFAHRGLVSFGCTGVENKSSSATMVVALNVSFFLLWMKRYALLFGAH